MIPITWTVTKCFDQLINIASGYCISSCFHSNKSTFSFLQRWNLSERQDRKQKWTRIVFCKNVNKLCTSLVLPYELPSGYSLLCGVWLLIGTAHWWRTRALYTASWKDEKRWNDETPVTSAWPLHDKDGLHQLSAGFMWLFLCLGPFFIFCLFLFLLVKIPGLVLI